MLPSLDVRAAGAHGNVTTPRPQGDGEELFYAEGEYVDAANPAYPLDVFPLIGAQWQPTLALSETCVWATISYNAGSSPCEKGGAQWQHALALLGKSGARQAKSSSLLCVEVLSITF